MALSQKHRSSLYQHLAPIVGEEEAEALLSQFPSRDLGEPVTKEFVRAEVADVRAEIADVRAEIAALRGDLTGEIGSLRAEMHDRFRAMTIWIASAMAVGMGLAAGLGRL
jgi:hypothetical protein